MRDIARAINKPESTVYRWRNENPDLFRAVREYAERKDANKQCLTN